jgi:hypothetical protein
VKLQGFADDEERPAAQEIETELAEREAEWPVCRYQVAHLSGEAVAILGHYTGQAQMVFNLATRLPFRHAGIATSMLARWSEQDRSAPSAHISLIATMAGQPTRCTAAGI